MTGSEPTDGAGLHETAKKEDGMDDFFKLPDASLPFPDVSQILRAAAPGPWIGGLTPMEVVIARSDRAAVVLNELAAFPDGFSLRITSHVHRSVKLPDQFSLMMGVPWGGSGLLSDEYLRIGIAWPDGARATMLDDWQRGFQPEAPDPDHGLESLASNADLQGCSTEYWAWPLPTHGELVVVVEWPAFGIPQSSTAVDFSLLTEAARRARPVWPEDAGKPSHLPRGGVCPPQGGPTGIVADVQ